MGGSVTPTNTTTTNGTAANTGGTGSTPDAGGDAQIDAGLAKIDAAAVRAIVRNLKVAEVMTDITGVKSAMGKISPV
jgi:hypothetical protein